VQVADYGTIKQANGATVKVTDVQKYVIHLATAVAILVLASRQPRKSR